MDAARFLRESDELNNKKWQRFSRSFFNEYRDTIMMYYGYEKIKYFSSVDVVKNPRLFIAIMDILLKFKIIDCNKTELANALSDVFGLTQHSSTIRRWIYETYPEYETFLTEFKNLFHTLKFNK